MDDPIYTHVGSTLENLQFVTTAIRDVLASNEPGWYGPGRDEYLDKTTDKIMSRIAEYMTPEALTLLKETFPEES